jgi:hypothetical protein
MTAATPRPGHHDKDDVVLVPFAKEHLEGALRPSQEMAWTHRLKDWAIALGLGQGLVLSMAAVRSSRPRPASAPRGSCRWSAGYYRLNDRLT